MPKYRQEPSAGTEVIWLSDIWRCQRTGETPNTVGDDDTVDIHDEEIEDEFAVQDNDTVDITDDDLEEEFAAPGDETVSNDLKWKSRIFLNSEMNSARDAQTMTTFTAQLNFIIGIFINIFHLRRPEYNKNRIRIEIQHHLDKEL